MEDNCLLSIIIPMYNVENYIERCLDSIVQEEVEDIEVLLIDDGSVDQTVEVCREYEKQYEYVHLFQQNHAGQGDARNLGVSKAIGKYIVFADADDYYESGAIKELYKAACEQDADVIMWGVKFVSKNSSWSRLYLISSKRSEFIATMNLSLWDKMFKKTFWEENNTKISNRYSEDIEVDVFLVAKAKEIHIISKVLYNYSVLRDGNLTSNASNVIQSSGSICNMLNKFKENMLFEKHKEELQYLCCRDACYHITNAEKTMTEEYKAYVRENFCLLLKDFFRIPEEFVCSMTMSKIIVIGNSKYLREFVSSEHYYNLEEYIAKSNNTCCLEYSPIYILDVSKELDAYKYGTLDKEKVLDIWQATCNTFYRIVKSSNVFLFHDTKSDKMQTRLMAEQILLNVCSDAKNLGFVDDSVELLDRVIKNMESEKTNAANYFQIDREELPMWSWDKARVEVNQNLLNAWLTLKFNGNNLEKYFIENNVKNIAIYGMGFLGNHLLKELKDSIIEVSYIIDKNKDKLNLENTKGFILGEELPQTEAIVVTPVQFFDSIYMELRCYTNIPIISLKQVIDYFL